MGLIRIFLALVVVADHLNIFFLQRAGLTFNGYLKLGLSGPSAVMLFYVISGFLISYALNHKYPADRTGTATFYRSRFARIYSVYWPMLAIVVVLDISGSRSALSSSWLDAVCAAGLIGVDWTLVFPSAHFNCLTPALGQAWTLGAELLFYATAPFLLRRSCLALGFFVISIGIRAALLSTIGASTEWTYYFLGSTLCFFLLGHFARIVTDYWRPPAILSWALLLSAIIASLPSATEVSWQTWHFYLALLCFAGALPGVFEATKPVKWLNWLGDLSYPLYLVHVMVLDLLFAGPVGTDLHVGAHGFSPQLWGAFVTGVSALLCILGAIAVHYCIERPTAGMLVAAIDWKFERATRNA